ncbi:MAG: PglZ domain-containing protein [Dethiosulfatibacter sp.]|nr:PglZ domain-containing protein [Dethiosulfatibacter sp.]
MSKIILYSDMNKTYQGTYNLLLNKIYDYVDVYFAIKQAIAENLEIVIVVQNRNCMNYLQGMASQYGYEYFEIREHSPRSQLADILKISIPDYISDEDIVKDQLISQANSLSYNKEMSFNDVIMQNYISVYFTHEKFPFSRIIELIQSFDYINFDQIMKKRITKKIFKCKLEDWLKSCNENYQKNIVKYFAKDPSELLGNISKYTIVRGYPQKLQTDILGALVKDFEKLKLKQTPFLIEGLNVLEIQRNIKICLNQFLISNLTKESITKNIEMVSGLIFDELEFALNMIEKNIDIIDEDIIRRVEQKFAPILTIHPQYHEKLKKILPPQLPQEPNKDFSTNEWLTWALNEYLPYKFWLEDNNSYNELIDDYAAMYGDWIYNNYHQLLSGESSMIFKTLINLSQSLSENTVSLIVMADNFNFKYVSLVKGFFDLWGFTTTMEKPLIAMIPTETSVSKTAFFSGEAYASKSKSYDKRCQEWQLHYNRSFKYLSDLSKMDEINQKSEDIYILNYSSIDRILHESQSDSALPINYRIQEELKALIGKIISFSKRIGYENEIKVYFVSDHGSTKIFPKQNNLIDSKYYKERAMDSAHRYISLSDKQFETYKTALGHLCYVLDKNDYGTQVNYLIARKYYRFINADGSFYVHGGITPEESIIPLIKFEKISIQLIEPELILRTNEFRYSTLSSIIFTVKNHNKTDLINVEIFIINRNVRSNESSYEIGKILSENEYTKTVQGIRIMKSDEEQSKLNVNLHYDFLGKRYQKEYSFDITAKSIQENKIDFEDMF